MGADKRYLISWPEKLVLRCPQLKAICMPPTESHYCVLLKNLGNDWWSERNRRDEATESQIDPSGARGNLKGDTREARITDIYLLIGRWGVRNAHHKKDRGIYRAQFFAIYRICVQTPVCKICAWRFEEARAPNVNYPRLLFAAVMPLTLFRANGARMCYEAHANEVSGSSSSAEQV